MSVYRFGQVLRPISRGILQQSAVSATRTCNTRTFWSTSPVCKRSNKLDPTMFGEGFEELVETGKLSADAEVNAAETSSAGKKAKPKLATKKVSDSLPLTLESILGDLPTASPSFDPKKFFKNWSTTAMEPTLSENGLTLFTYMSKLIESPACIEALASVDHHQALEFKKRWIVYELDQGNLQAHLPLVEFFLQRGLKLLPPAKGTAEVDDRIERIDRESAQAAMREVDISGTWTVNTSVLDELKGETIEYPDLMTPDALLDPRDVLEIPSSKNSPFHNRVVVRNHRSIFHNYAEGAEDDLLEEDELAEDENNDQDEMLRSLPVPTKYYKDLQQSILMRRGVVQQTGKGKIKRVAFMVLVGDGNGLVGYGEGKHSTGATAIKAARLAAVRNMDYVERFEQRTIWTEMSTKLGSTHLILRPRPVGFGLRCNPHLHRILRAAGMKDMSAKVWGSRNKLNVIKAAFRLLHSGHAPTVMGDGLGGKGKKLAKGGGMKGKHDIERARGRKLVNLRK